MSAAKRFDILCLGEPMVEFVQSQSPSEAGRWIQGFGGDVSNVAIAAARQGSSTGMVTRLGQDGFGDDIVRLWAQNGVDASAVARDAARGTGVYFIRYDASGHVFEYRRAGSAASALSPENLPLDALADAHLLHLSGISQAISESCAEACMAAIRAVRAAGGRVAYDPNLRLKLWPLDRARTVIHAAMAECDIALPGLDDAQLLTERESPEDVARFYLDLGPSIVALTLGADGALIATRDGLMERIPPRPTNAVDASGAGDCFDGAFLHQLLRTGDPIAAGRYAVTAASLSVENYGCVAAIPYGASVQAALEGAATVSTSGSKGCPLTVACVAHDKLKPSMAQWIAQNRALLAPHQIIATGTTAGVIAEAAPELSIRAMKSGPLGGDQQIGGMIAERAVDALIFFPDPMTPMPHDVDVKALLRIAILTDTPCAFSRASADLLAASGFFGPTG